MVINTLGDDCLLRMRAFIPLLVNENLTYSNQVIIRKFFYFSVRSIHCVHVDTGVLFDVVGHLTQCFMTNKSSKVEGAVTY